MYVFTIINSENNGNNNGNNHNSNKNNVKDNKIPATARDNNNNNDDDNNSNKQRAASRRRQNARPSTYRRTDRNVILLIILLHILHMQLDTAVKSRRRTSLRKSLSFVEARSCLVWVRSKTRRRSWRRCRSLRLPDNEQAASTQAHTSQPTHRITKNETKLL